jgi:hypothetical protein
VGKRAILAQHAGSGKLGEKHRSVSARDFDPAQNIESGAPRRAYSGLAALGFHL